MLLKRYLTATDYLKENQQYLEEEEVINSLILGLAIANKGAEKDLSLYLDIRSNAGIQFTAIKTVGRNLLIYGKPETLPIYAPILIDFLAQDNIDPPGINGLKELVLMLSPYFQKQLKWNCKVEFEQLTYELTSVRFNPSFQGKMEKGSLRQLSKYTKWMQNFYEQALYPITEKEAAIIVQNKIRDGELYIWHTDTAVSMTCIARPTSNGITINYVYTPLEHRQNGYATKLVAEVSSLMLRNGYRFCTLFTDLNNPTSNNIYKKIGYLPIAEFKSVKFIK